MTDGVAGFGYDVPELDERDPYKKPDRYLQRVPGEDGVEVINGRRPSTMLLVPKLREEVDAWRDAGSEGASATTQRLFQWWFEEATGEGLQLYWGQREAIETIAYLLEIAGAPDVEGLIGEYLDAATLGPEFDFQTTVDGVRQFVRAREGKVETFELPPADLPRFAVKMATGTGKTFVMALVIVWSYFHRRLEPGSPLSTNFLVLAPNVIVFERLRIDFENAKVFNEHPLVPPEWSFDLKVILRGETTEPGGAGTLVVTNIQQLYETDSSWTPANAVEALLGRKPVGAAATKGRSMLERVRALERLVVLNDEAHHVHDEDLVWNRTLRGLHDQLPTGLSLWLDFSATPKFQTGAYFPWIVCDYPLAQAVEDQIVKAPMILHLVNQADPAGVTAATIVDQHRDWLIAGLQRLEEHEKVYREVGVRPVMFVMCESIRHADALGAWLRDSAGAGMKDEEVLVIHTDTAGEVRKGDLDELRRAAREIDEPDNSVRVVVSVLVLREGWDVRNVTIVLGLRPGTATARILPEQAVGRGLRLMRDVSPDQRQVLEVLGTPAFENFVRELELEGVHVQTVTKPPKPPITVQPIKERLAFDIAIPETGPTLRRIRRKIEELDLSGAEARFTSEDLGSVERLRAIVEAAPVGVNVGVITFDHARPPLGAENVSAVVGKTQAHAGLTGEFASLVAPIGGYLGERCFGGPVDLDDDQVRVFLGQPSVQENIAAFLAKHISELSVEQQPIEVTAASIRLAQTKPYVWRREHTTCKKTVFNYVATYNAFETAFAEFLEKCNDVARFAALAEHFTRFTVEYLKPSGAIGHYYPDWVTVQNTDDGEVNWIIETKGRVWEGTEQKDAAIRYWCEQVTESGGVPWHYMRVDQPVFKPDQLGSFLELVLLVRSLGESSGEQLVVE